jgi:hypothetical protein
VCQGSDKDFFGSQLQARTSPCFYKHLRFTMHATSEPCDISVALAFCKDKILPT